MNLLPVALRKQLLIRRTLRAWGVVWGVLLAAMAVVAGAQWSEIESLDHRRTVVATACQPIRQLQSEIVQLAAKQTSQSQRAAALRSLQSDGRALRLLEQLSQQRSRAIEPVQVRAVVTAPLAAAPQTTSNSKKTAPQPAPVQPAWLVTLTGVAATDTAVNELVATLRESNRFGRVELKSIANGPAAEQSGRDWAIECHY